MRIITIVGARPQFMKAAMMSRILDNKHEEIVIHTGQHYDSNMSDVFFRELAMRPPKYNLGIAGGSHGQMTGRMLIAIEEVLLQEKPDTVIVYGDTNSTTAGALAAVKLGIPVVHIEAGNTRGSLSNPEDVNRIVSDHLGTILFACVESAIDNLKTEGLGDRAYFVGDSMYDAYLHYSELARLNERRDLFLQDGTVLDVPQRYYYMTCHRQENAGTDEPMRQIFSAMQELDALVLYPVHPRNRERALRVKAQYGYDNVVLMQPVGYLSSLALMNNCQKVLTDSGGLQREAFFANKQCVTVFEYAWWPETLHNGMNRLARPEKEDILEKIFASAQPDAAYLPFGNGDACEKMGEIIERELV